MSVSGLCQVCQTGQASHQCTSCGSFVCEDHYRHGVARCSVCAQTGGHQM